ncbi:MAG TPA: LptE family protein [Prolixibacteraceae bacterium]|nr:LptE family protein [Prolixibacteraceae bacterium]
MILRSDMKAGRYRNLVLAILIFATLGGCKIYSFTGANISADVKTFSVYYFTNRAKLVNPALSSDFTEKLKEKLIRQTSLKEESENGDLVFEGQITGYEVRPMAVQKDDMAAQNRLTVSVRLKYTNNRNHEDDFDKTFSAYEDFSSSMSLNDVESSIVPDILDKLMEDIFNATIANW